MTIAEFFVNIGIKGDGGVKKGLQGVKGGLSDVKSMSLEAKAAIIGAIYALERMMSTSAKSGTGFMNFATLTGQSAEELQRWQYAARQVGVAGEEMEGSFKAVQQAMTNMLLGKGAPEGMAMLANKVGFDPAKARDTFYVMEQLQKFAKTVPADVGNNMMKSFGVSDNVISAMRQNAFRPEVRNKAPMYSDSEIGRLQKVDVAWANLGNKFQMAMGHLTAKHGLGMVKEISQLADQVLKLLSAFTLLAEKLELIKGIGKVFEGWTKIFEGVTAIASGKVSIKDITDGYKDFVVGAGTSLQEAVYGKDYQEAVAPPTKGAGKEKPTQNINVNQNLNFQHDGKDAKKTSGSVHKAVKDAYRQMSAQGQGG